jgi:hypothetical protein
MHDQITVCIIDCFADLEKDTQAGIHAEPPFLATAVDALPVHLFGYQEGVAGRGNSSVEESGDIVVIQNGQKLALRFEAPENFAVGQIACHYFQGDVCWKWLSARSAR